MLAIEMLPAEHGDCLWIEYGDPADPHRVLVDCGLRSTYRELADRLRDRPEIKFELLVLTHIDADHILGAIPLLQEIDPKRFGDVWFNGWKHLNPPDAMGALHGEMFAAILEKRGFNWNRSWNGGAVVLPDSGDLPRIELPGGLKLTLLSPTRERLADLRIAWERELEAFEAGDTEAAMAYLQARPRFQPDALGPERIDVEELAEQPFEPDDSAANGSSIALLAEYEGKTLLLGADAFSPVLESSIRRLLRQTGQRRLQVDACKIPHHGARANNGPGFLSLLDCRDFLFSSNGSHGYHHPHRETVARILTTRRESRLHFNYRTRETGVWDDSGLQRDWNYEARYPAGQPGYRLAF
ncbi:MAG TPA: MBL fold metallo-hydrolase [Thermoanaerobaculia bacterium]|jgi:beta-lactamase superfamily II metal-dependent hydrolase|nr:MBL fold metallo-hydrolase [Thermoanaerobaculia bacterium]